MQAAGPSKADRGSIQSPEHRDKCAGLVAGAEGV